MSIIELGHGAALSYDYHAPTSAEVSFVFVNALTGSATLWEDEVCPALREEGSGTLTYNLRGQHRSPAGRLDRLDEALMVADLQALMEQIAPPRPILVGLSIGGLYAAKAWLAGTDAAGLVLINTLRLPGQRLDWINEAIARVMRMGDTRAVMDFFGPMLVGPEGLKRLAPDCLKDEAYVPPGPGDSVLRLVLEARSTEWDLAYEQLALPVLVMSGLKDRMFLDVAEVKGLVGRMPDAEHLEFPVAGHLIPLEEPKRTTAELLKFAERLA